MPGLNNVFDSQDEYDKLKGFILEGVEKFSDYRNQNLTYGEIMYVMEGILDNLRGTSEKAAKNVELAGMTKEALTFTSLAEIVSRFIEVGLKKGTLDSSEEAYVLHGEK